MTYLEYQQYATRASGSTCPALTIDTVYENDGTTVITPNGDGFYELEDSEPYFISLTDVTPSSTNEPVLGVISPAFTGSTELTVYRTAGISKNRLELAVDGSTGENTHTINATWDDGTCVRVGAMELKFEVI